ncbi:MAG TPA: hypothetical protein IAA88_04025 [Candidatus Avimuribaculum pullicola]|nr:hypothetical protein [Candidatus Avimuribaculum pullicola]
MAIKKKISMFFARVGMAIWDFLGGKIITVELIKRHFAKIALVLFVTLGFIANRFSAMVEMRRIAALEQQLDAVRSDYLLLSEKYYTTIRGESVRQLVDTTKLGLVDPVEPPYSLKDTNNER